MIRPKETEDLIFIFSKKWETLIERTHTKAQETLEFILIQSRETFHFNPPAQLKDLG